MIAPAHRHERRVGAQPRVSFRTGGKIESVEDGVVREAVQCRVPGNVEACVAFQISREIQPLLIFVLPVTRLVADALEIGQHQRTRGDIAQLRGRTDFGCLLDGFECLEAASRIVRTHRSTRGFKIRAPQVFRSRSLRRLSLASGIPRGGGFETGPSSLVIRADSLPDGDTGADEQCGNDCEARGEGELVAFHQSAKAVERTRGTRMNGFAGKVPLDVFRQSIGRLIAASAVLFERLHHDPVEITPKQAGQLGRVRMAMLGDIRTHVYSHRVDEHRGRLRLLLADDAPDFIVSFAHQLLGIEGRSPREQFV